MPADVSAYIPLANITIPSTATLVTFSSISQSYKDLILVADASSTANNYPFIRLNTDSGATNYAGIWAWGNGTTVNFNNTTGTNDMKLDQANLMNTTKTMFTFSLMDYSATDKFKSALMRVSKADGFVNMSSTLWKSTAAVSTITLHNTNGFATGSTFALYGVSA